MKAKNKHHKSRKMRDFDDGLSQPKRRKSDQKKKKTIKQEMYDEYDELDELSNYNLAEIPKDDY